MIALLSGSYVHAQGAGGTYALKATPNNGYSGGNFVPTTNGAQGKSIPYAYIPNSPATPYYGGVGGAGGGPGDVVSVTGSGALSATFVWSPSGTPPPPAAIVHQQCNVFGFAAGSVNSFIFTGDAGMGTGFAADKYTVVTNPGASFSIPAADGLSPTVTASGTIAPNGGGAVEGQVVYIAAASPVTVTLPGTTPDASGNPHILIGQKCMAVLNGIPSGCTVSNIRWNVTGNTIQVNSWFVPADYSSATFPGFFNPYTYTQSSLQAAAPGWYWDDKTGQQTISCTCTVTPTAGQGAAFTLSVSQKISVEEPQFTSHQSVGVVQINKNYPAQTPVSLKGVPVLYAGAGNGSLGGIIYYDTVRTPTNVNYTGGTNGTGIWFHTQLATASRHAIPLGGGNPVSVPGDSTPGALDSVLGAAIVYDTIYKADGVDGGTAIPRLEGDEPGQPLSNSYQEYKIDNETHEDYIMYQPPSNSLGAGINVPLAYFFWTWSSDVTDVPSPGSWALWGNAPVNGTITASGAATRTINFPLWTCIESIQGFP